MPGLKLRKACGRSNCIFDSGDIYKSTIKPLKEKQVYKGEQPSLNCPDCNEFTRVFVNRELSLDTGHKSYAGPGYGRRRESAIGNGMKALGRSLGMGNSSVRPSK